MRPKSIWFWSSDWVTDFPTYWEHISELLLLGKKEHVLFLSPWEKNVGLPTHEAREKENPFNCIFASDWVTQTTFPVWIGQ